jgi:hypothetical protein
MGLLLLTILIAPLPLMLAVTGWELFFAPRPVEVRRELRFRSPREERDPRSR